MPRSVLKALRTRLEDSERLIEIHEDATGNEPGRRRGYDVLNRSALMLSIAAWEGFTEDLLRYAVGFLGQRISSPDELPANVRDAMIAKMHSEQAWARLSEDTKKGIWSLTGAGWRVAYIDYAASKINNLHTPNHENLNKLFKSVVGLTDFSAQWGGGRWSKDNYISRLDKALALRHRIAHGALGDETVKKARANDAIKLISRVAGWTSAAVDEHVIQFDLRPKKEIEKNVLAAVGRMNAAIS